MQITIEINTDNAAFEDAPGQEVARILRKAADRLEDWPGANAFGFSLLDYNRNKVGRLDAD